MNPAAGRIVVDRSHLGRRASGIERITRELFSEAALAPLRVEGTAPASSRTAMMLAQQLAHPAALARDRSAVWVFPGYPPSPAFALAPERTVLYVHDLFLLTRPGDLNRAARHYMAPGFRIALARLRHFLVNSETTGRELRARVGPGASVVTYRPVVADVFGIAGAPPPEAGAGRPLRVGAVGTVEPRKNLPAAARITAALARRLGREVELHVVGRAGWGPDHAALAREPHVRLHGFLPDTEARAVIGGFDLLLSTSHDEGLGLPLLEVQHGGVPVAAPDAPVFREVLGASGTFLDPADAEGAALVLARLVAGPGWRAPAAAAARANVAGWNLAAARDRGEVVALLGGLSERAASAALARSWRA